MALDLIRCGMLSLHYCCVYHGIALILYASFHVTLVLISRKNNSTPICHAAFEVLAQKPNLFVCHLVATTTTLPQTGPTGVVNFVPSLPLANQEGNSKKKMAHRELIGPQLSKKKKCGVCKRRL